MGKEGRVVWSHGTSNAGNVANIFLLCIASIQELFQLLRKASTVNSVLAAGVAPCDEKAVLEAKGDVVDLLKLCG
jgi:hypothetical protein